MTKKISVVMAQLNFLVGDIEGNTKKIIDNASVAKQTFNADLIIFPELALTGYPPEDLLLRDGLYERTTAALELIKAATDEIDILLGYPLKEDNDRYNAASLISRNKILGTYRKMCLPNYSVFDEVRYFKPGKEPLVIDYRGIPLGITICEDLWHKTPFAKSLAAGAKVVISINASPYDMSKHETRVELLTTHAMKSSVPILYVNCVGGQDELVFDGGSLVCDESGMIHQCGPFYEESLIHVEIHCDSKTNQISLSHQGVLPLLPKLARIYEALVLGVRDYIHKNHFPSAVLGLSGGIDSALTLAIAVDAIGAENVRAVLMPSPFTSKMSNQDALAQAATMKVKTSVIPINEPFEAILEILEPEIGCGSHDITEQNLQARCRGNILMAISNKVGCIVLSTGNKSEISVGYCTLYGDMVGGFCVLKDIPKTLVYQLAEYRNSLGNVIPQRVIEREPSAELAPGQRDQDTLPPYPVLDKILELYIDKDQSYQHIVEQGFDPEIVKQVIIMVDKNEYKRRQAPPGVRISKRAFGRDRRYPITSGYTNFLRFKS